MMNIVKFSVLAIFLVLILDSSSVTGLHNSLLGNNPRVEKSWAETFLRKPKLSSVEKLKEIRRLSSPELSKLGDERAEICYTDECLDAALFLLKSINFTVDPCDNFFQYSCGRWLSENPIPPTSSRWSHFDVLIENVNQVTQGILTTPAESDDFKPVKQVKEFYNLCLDTDAMEEVGLIPVLATLVAYGGWPAVTPNWVGSSFNVIQTIGDIRRVFLDSILVDIYVTQDLKNTTKSVVYFDQPYFFLSRSVLLNQEQFQPRINAYKAYFVNVAKEFAVLTGAQVTDADLNAQVSDVIAFETRLAEISAADEDRNIIDRIYNPRKLDAYQDETDAVGATQPHAKIVWKDLLDSIFSTSGVVIGAQEDLIVAEVDYLSNLTKVLDTTDIRTIANYITWRLVSGLIPETTQTMRDIAFEFDKVNSGLVAPKPRETTCADVSLNGFGMAIGVKYIEEAFEASSKDNVDLMVENLRTAFKELLDEADWMDEATKSEAERKANTMKQFMAYPEWLFNKTRVEQEFAGLEIVSGAYLSSVIELSHWMGDVNLKTLRAITDKDYWLTYPGVVNAFYAPQYNSITFPAGILAPPFYRSNGPESINYGGIGVVIGHEITHGFDDSGSQFDADGNAQNWWSEEILEKFYEKAQCIVDQYSAFETEVGFVNGDLTSGENIADNGGVRQSFLAYQNWVKNSNGGVEEPRLPGLEALNPNQLFFLGYGNIWCEAITLEGLENQLLGDPHSPARFRVLGPLQNSETFSEHWNCPAGSPMNPPVADKCALSLIHI